MVSLKEEAENYVPKKTSNIADLDIVPISIDIQEGTGIDDDGKEYTYKYAEIDGEKYRVPNIVIDNIKTMISENPSLTHVKVIKKGTGLLETKYTVVQKESPKDSPTEDASMQA